MDDQNEIPRAADDSQVWDTLRAAHGAYLAATSPAYDQVLKEVADRIQAVGSIGKADIGALLFWKHLRANTPWVSDLMTWQDSKVRAATENAVRAVTDASLSVAQTAWAGRVELKPLPGFRTGDALASALLLAAAPSEWPCTTGAPELD